MEESMHQPPPPKIPPPGTVLTEEEENALPSGSMVDLTPELLERTLGFPVIDLTLYQTAFMHDSAAELLGRPSYQRLEYLGDAVLGFVTAKFLFDQYPMESEGFLTIIRTRLTRSDMLAKFAQAYDLGRFVVLPGKGLYRGWYNSKKTLEDVFEALIGAIYLDLGLATAKQFIITVFETLTDFEDLMKDRNYKDQLMRLQHARAQPLPIYQAQEDRENRTFHVLVDIDGYAGRGSHRTKKGAEQAAARDMLIKLGQHIDE